MNILYTLVRFYINQMGDLYEFNPYEYSNHTKLKYLGTPGACNVAMGTVSEDPKIKGPCGREYQFYRECLRITQFNRNDCRKYENQVSECQHTRIGEKAQIQLLKDWKKNKGIPVMKSHVAFKFYEEEPEVLRGSDIK